jgi:hypothetical protein
MPLVKHVSGDHYCYAEDAGEGAWAYGPLHHSEIPATAAGAMEILDAQSRESLEADGAWLYDEVVANRAFGVDYPAPDPIFTAADVGCYLDSARGVYIGEEIQASAALHGWAPADTGVVGGVIPSDHEECKQPHQEADHGTLYHEATNEAEDYLNGLTADDVWFGPTESGDWGLWPLEEEKS